MGRIACAHPGKLGDALYALPACRALAARHGCAVDFYTSPYCAPLRRLFEAQACIANFIVSPAYVLHDFSCGAQPWKVPIPEEQYDAVYQMGLRHVPHASLPDHVAASGGLPGGLPIHYDFDLPPPDIDEPYIVTAPRPTLPGLGVTQVLGIDQPIKI